MCAPRRIRSLYKTSPTPLRGTPLRGTPLRGTPLRGTPLRGTPLDPPGGIPPRRGNVNGPYPKYKSLGRHRTEGVGGECQVQDGAP